MASVVMEKGVEEPIRSGMAVSRRMKWLMVGCGMLFTALWGIQVVRQEFASGNSLDLHSYIQGIVAVSLFVSYAIIWIWEREPDLEFRANEIDVFELSPLDSRVANLSSMKFVAWMSIVGLAITFEPAIADFRLFERFNGLAAIAPFLFPYLFGTQKARLRILESGLLFIGPVSFTLYPWGTIEQVEFKHLEHSDLVRVTARDSKKKTVEQEILLVKPDEERWRELQRVIGERVGVIARREVG